MSLVLYCDVGVEHARPCPGESLGLKQGRACSTPTAVHKNRLPGRRYSQNVSFMPSWMLRGLLDCVVIRPYVPLAGFTSGWPNQTRFSALISSQRNCSFT